MKRTALVSGGAGYIGSHVGHALIEAGWNVVVIDNLVTGMRELVPDSATYIEADIGDTAHSLQVLRDHDCSAVLHFAGSTVVPESLDEPLKYYRNNTCASRNLIEACVTAGIGHFIFSSTAAVYGNPEVLPVREDSPLLPLSPYGTSKLMTEMMLRDTCAATPLRALPLRYFNVAGADPAGRCGQSTPAATHLIKVACEAACGKRDGITVYGDDYDTPDGTCMRDYIHVSDLASAHVAALDYLIAGGDGQPMNCGYGGAFSVKQVLDTVEEVVGAPLNITMGPRRAGDAASVYAVSDRARKELGWRPKYDDLKTIVETAYAWESRGTEP